MAKNKVFTKYMLPYYIGTGFFSLIILGTTALALKDAKEQRKHPSTTKSIVKQTIKNYS